MGSAPAIGYGRAGLDPGGSYARYQSRKHGFLTAMQVVGPGCVDDEAIGWIGGDDRRVAQRPERHSIESFCVTRRIKIEALQPRKQDLGLACRHADAQTGRAGGAIGGQHEPPVSLPA